MQGVGGSTVLITGATGALGGAVVRAFERAEWSIRSLSRRAPQQGSAASRHRHFAGEIDDPRVLSDAMDGVDVVVHMAALLHVVDPAASLAGEYVRVNAGGTAAVAAAAARSGVRRVVALSTIAVYGPSAQMADEDTPPAPDTAYGRTKLDAERTVLDTVNQEAQPLGCVLRLAAVYGPSIKGNYERLVRALARRRFLPIGPGRNLRTLVFEDDAAAAILLAATSPRAAGGVFNVTDGEVHRVDDIVAAISRALDHGKPRLAVPLPLARAAVRGVEAMCGAAGLRSPVTRATLEKYVEDVAVSGDRIRQVLGFQPQWTLAEGWRQTIRQLRQEGRL